jgi:hypothetical protein
VRIVLHVYAASLARGLNPAAMSLSENNFAGEMRPMLKRSTVRLIAFNSLCAAALATSVAAHAQVAMPQPVKWELQVMSDGQQIDAFSGTTSVGQARTDTHHHVVKNRVGCADQPAGDIDLQRTLTLSPVHASADDVTLSIEAQETLEDPSNRTTAEGCKLPPQPRQVNASHPGLVLKPGEWSSWTIIEKNPSLTYRVRASLSTPAQ